MRPLIISSGGAFAKVIKEHEQLKKMSRCVFLDTSKADLDGFSSIDKNGKKSGYIIMNEDLDNELLSKYGIPIGIRKTNDDGYKGSPGMHREKEVFVLAFALDGKNIDGNKIDISSKIWGQIRDCDLDKNADCIIFLAGLAGGTGSGSINSLINNYYENVDTQRSKHAVMGILPSNKEIDKGETPERIRLNALWALYELMVGHPAGRKSPIILLDNQAMMIDGNPKPIEPVGNVLSMFNDWRPDRDGGDMFSGRGSIMVPYYASIKKDYLNEINEIDIDNMLINLQISNVEANTNSNSGRWYLTVNQDDITKVSGGQLLTKGIPNELRYYLKNNILNHLNIADGKLTMQESLLNVPGKAEFLLLLTVNNGFELSRIKGLYSDVHNIEDAWLRRTIKESIPNKASSDVVIEFISKMKATINEAIEATSYPKKYQIVFTGNGFEVAGQDT